MLLVFLLGFCSAFTAQLAADKIEDSPTYVTACGLDTQGVLVCVSKHNELP